MRHLRTDHHRTNDRFTDVGLTARGAGVGPDRGKSKGPLPRGKVSRGCRNRGHYPREPRGRH